MLYSPGQSSSTGALPDIITMAEGASHPSCDQHRNADLFPDNPHADETGSSTPGIQVVAPPSDSAGKDTQDMSPQEHHASLVGSVTPGRSKREDYSLVLSKTAIIVIDVQGYLSSPESTDNLATSDDEKNNFLYNISLPNVVVNISELVTAIRKHRDTDERSCGCEVIFTYLEALTKDCRDVSLDYKLSGPKLAQLPSPSKPAEFLSNLKPSTSHGKGDILIPKTSCSVFNSTNIAYILRNLQCEQVLLVGQLTDQCVESAARDAADLGFFVTVVEDACAATGVEEHAKGLAGICGFARIMTTKQVLSEIERGAADEAHSRNKFNMQRHVPSGSNDTEQSPGPDSATEPIHTPDTAMALKPSEFSIKPAELWRGRSRSATIPALLHALKAAGVEFLRYATLDTGNSIRCKSVPLSSFDKNCSSLDNKVSIAEVCFAGLPRYADTVVSSTNLSAARVLVLNPDIDTLRILPYAPRSAIVLCTAHDQLTGRLSPLCTRGLLVRLMDTARQDFGLRFNVGAEIEFTLFREGNDRSSSSGRRPVDSSCFAHSTILNEQEEFISALRKELDDQDIDIEMVHSESAPGQLEVVLKYQEDAMRLADNVILARETIRACAKAHGMRALFLPKIEAFAAGNGMHLHFSFSDAPSGKPNAFSHQSKPSAMSSLAEAFIEGMLRHLPALLAVTMPSKNSFRRVGEGCWTGHDIRWAIEDKEVPLRVCFDLQTRQASNVEYKLFDGSANIYLGIASILAAGMDGISQSLKLRPSVKLSGGDYPQLPQSLEDSLQALENDALLQGVLGNEMSAAYIALRRNEIEHYSSTSLDDEVADAYHNA